MKKIEKKSAGCKTGTFPVFSLPAPVLEQHLLFLSGAWCAGVWRGGASACGQSLEVLLPGSIICAGNRTQLF